VCEKAVSNIGDELLGAELHFLRQLAGATAVERKSAEQESI